MTGNRRKNRGESGLSLMEMMVAMALVATTLGLAVPYIGGVLGVDARKSSRQLAGSMRYMYDRASITGDTYRLALNVDRHAWWAEVGSSEGEVLIYENQEKREDGQEKQKELLEELEKARERSMSASANYVSLPMSDRLLSNFSRVEEPGLKPVILPETVTLEGVWTPQYDEIQRPAEVLPEDEADDNIVYIHFFAGGYAERAYVYVSDGDDDWYTLEIEPLTGRVIVYDEEVEVPRDYMRQ